MKKNHLKIKQIYLKKPWLNDYWYMDYYEDDKETYLRLFKLKFAHVFNDLFFKMNFF